MKKHKVVLAVCLLLCFAAGTLGAEDLEQAVALHQQSLDMIWLLLAAALVFFMQAGFYFFAFADWNLFPDSFDYPPQRCRHLLEFKRVEPDVLAYCADIQFNYLAVQPFLNKTHLLPASRTLPPGSRIQSDRTLPQVIK